MRIASMSSITRTAALTGLVGAIAIAMAGCGSASTSANAPTVTNSAIQTNSQGQTVSTPSSGSGSTPPSTSTGSGTSASTGALTISTGQVAGLGSVLVTSTGRTIYMFVPDHQSKVTCVASCAALWPPVLLGSGQTAVGTGGVKTSLLGSDPNPGGGRVVTYNKWPLYTFASDTSAGTATGQALNLNGGLWYVLSPSGALITRAG